MKQLLNILSSRLSPIGDSVRLFHGRGKMIPGLEHLSIDSFPPHVLITTYKEISDEEKHELKNVIETLPGVENILLQKRYIKNDPVEALKGAAPDSAFAVEKGEKYLINLKNPQNIGFFLDMMDGREWLKKNSQDKFVLNLFSYTCSLSVAALKGGARQANNYDMSKAALRVGEDNHKLNGVKAKFFPHDIMKSLGSISKKGPYDLIIIDPPTNQGLSFKVERDYHKIIKRLSEMTAEGSLVMACLNATHLKSDFLLDAFKEHAPMFTLIEKVDSAFITMDANPEEGLKILIFKKIAA